MKKLTAILFLTFISYYAASAQLQSSHIQDIIQKEVDSKRSKSIIVGIIDSSGRQTFSAGVLSDKNQQRPDGNTIYEIGSITKVFTTLLLADMSLKWELNLDDYIGKFLPGTVKTPEKEGKQITLLNLATHRAGFPRNPNNLDPENLENPFADYTTSRLYEYISNFKYNDDINSRFRYSNLGYNLLGHILTLVTAKDFETLVKERIARPLDMNSTVISLTPRLRENMAAPHAPYGKPVMEWDIAFAGGGGLRSNTNDLLTFAAANLGLAKTPLLPAMELSHIPQAKKDGTDGFITMGWTLFSENGKHIVWKDGSTGGYHTFIGLDKKNKRAVVILSNSTNSITDIGLHLLDSTRAIIPYRYEWKVYDTVYAALETRGVDTAIEIYRQLKASKPTAYVFDERQLNSVANDLRKAKKIEEAIAIYRYNLTEYPNSVVSYESLGETYKRNGNKKLAVEVFEKLAEMDPKNSRWRWMVNTLKSQY